MNYSKDDKISRYIAEGFKQVAYAALFETLYLNGNVQLLEKKELRKGLESRVSDLKPE